MMSTTCMNCGGDSAIHHYETNQCPVGGVEAPIGRRQEWKSTTFQPENNDAEELREDFNDLSLRVANLEAKFARLEEQIAGLTSICPIPDDFYCPCGCDGIADQCVYAAKCTDCGAKYYAANGHTDCPAAK